MELAVLQAVRLKGRVDRDGLTATLGSDPGPVVGELVAAGLLTDGPMLRLTPNGRARLHTLLADERSRTDPVALRALYAEFRCVNADLKTLFTDWQVRDGHPNTHDDADYDAEVFARLDDVHRRAAPTVGAVVVALPRLRRYAEKLQAALDRVSSGDPMWLTRPLIDSYHTVWFELHEELILAAGLTREAEDG